MSDGLWIVVCPQTDVKKPDLWGKWYVEQCVAVGWPPCDYPLNGVTDNLGWKIARTRLGQMQPGDSVIPFLKDWTIGPVGIIKRLRIGDDQWDPTVPAGKYIRNPIDSELGRRIDVEWVTYEMPESGLVAVIPPKSRLNRPESRHTVSRLTVDRFNQLVKVLGDPKNWIEAPISRRERTPRTARLH